ncbi:hypothetical protein [Pontibacter sp. BAB1700]|uniref:hypothetical protein n=1 Tax=Pontibacter sp. BAB1700 TaxID=1144253 RepID=UPI00026BE14B|nr:hypothetical protein [Pontibacter sp. BAB1700]EJF08918.1 hypothetical protein O71_18091 [Pontibacter sp. BAB1700]
MVPNGRKREGVVAVLLFQVERKAAIRSTGGAQVLFLDTDVRIWYSLLLRSVCDRSAYLKTLAKRDTGHEKEKESDEQTA